MKKEAMVNQMTACERRKMCFCDYDGPCFSKRVKSTVLESESSHQCEICDSKFKAKPILKRHVESVHGIGGSLPFKWRILSQTSTEGSGKNQKI